MSYRAIKCQFENRFKNDWADTPIHWAGQEFDVKGIDERINPYFVPTSTRKTGIADGSTLQRGLFNVVCWAKNDADVFTLADKVNIFMKDCQYNITFSEMADHGWSDSNYVYALMLYEIEIINC